MATRRRLKLPILALMGGTLAAAVTQAGVVVESTFEVDGRAISGMAANGYRLTEAISGDRAQTELRRYPGRVITIMAISPVVEITRLDEDKVYQIHVVKQSAGRPWRYSERSLADVRAELKQIEASSYLNDVTFDVSRCQWSPVQSKLTRGAQSRVAEIDADQWTVLTTQTCTDSKTRGQCHVALRTRLATATKGIVSEELGRFRELYQQKLGLINTVTDMGDEPNIRARAMLGRFGSMWNANLEKMQSIKAQLLKSEISLLASGPACKVTFTRPVSAFPSWPSKSLGNQLVRLSFEIRYIRDRTLSASIFEIPRDAQPVKWP
jgi:hypothetical protein